MSRIQRTTVCLVAVALVGCHHKPNPPKGQVAAVVEGHEITVRQVNAELGSNVPSDPKLLKIAQSRALQTVILRTLLANKAMADGLQKTPDYALEEQRLKEGLLASLYQTKLAAAVPAPTDDEIQAYMNAHPDIFSQRKIFTLEQVLMAGPVAPNIAKALAPLKTPDQVAALLSSQGIAFQRQTVELDAVGADPRMVAALSKLAPTDMLIVPQGRVVVLNAVKSVRTQPFTGDAAITYAKNLIHTTSVQEAEARQLQALMRSAAPTIAFNPAYKPASAAPAVSHAPNPPN